MADEDEASGDEDDRIDETDDEKAERQFKEMVGMADDVINRFNQTAPAEIRDTAIAEFIETGTLSHKTAQVDELETVIVVTAFEQHAERNVFKPLGLTQAQYNSYVDDADMRTLRRAVVAGDWGTLYRHAETVAAHIKANGDSNAGLY